MKTLMSAIIVICAFSVSLHAQSFKSKTLDWGSGGKTGQHTSQAIIKSNPAIAYFNETKSSLMFARNSKPDGSGTWSITTVDYIGYVGQYPSLAEVNGTPAISYFDNTNSAFKYIRSLDAFGTRWGTPVTLERTTNAWQESTLLVVNGNPAVSYCARPNSGTSNGVLKYIRALDSDGTTWNSPQIIDSSFGAGSFPSMAVINGNPAVGFYGGGALYFIRSQDVNGTSWGDPKLLEGGPPFGSGERPCLVVVNGNPAIAYLGSSSNNHFSLKFMRADDVNGASWSPSVVLDDSADYVGLYASLAIIDGSPAISYYDYTNRDLKYIRSNDANGTTWSSRITLDYNGDVGSFTSMAQVNSCASVSYYDATNGDLKYIRVQNTGSGNWPVASTVDSGFQSGDVGHSTSQFIVNGNPAIAYYDTTNFALKYLRALDSNGTNWESPVTIDGAGDDGYVSLNVVNGKPAIAYFGKSAVLKYVQSLDANGSTWGPP